MTEVDPDNETTFQVCVIKSDRANAHIPQRAILEELNRHGFCEEVRFAVKLALEEAIANAVTHGNRCDGSKTVTIRYAVNRDRAVVIVRDEGPGFLPEDVPDPTEPHRLALPSGRGIMLIRAYMDEVRYRDHGREIYFVKHRKQK